MTVLVVLKKGTDSSVFKQALADTNLVFKHFEALDRIFKVEVDDLDAFTLKEHVDVESAEYPIAIPMELQATTVDLLNVPIGEGTGDKSQSWGLARICRRNNPFYGREGALPSATSSSYKYTRTGLGVDVYVLDVGFDPEHPEIVGRGTHLVGGSTTAKDYGHFHGLGVSSNIAGTNVGVAKEAHIYYSVTSGTIVDTTDEHYAEELDLILDHYLSRANTNRPAVLNISSASHIGFSQISSVMAVAMDAIISNGIPVTTAAGNHRLNLDEVVQSPSEADPDVLAIGGCSVLDSPMHKVTFGTSVGVAVQLYAPGLDLAVALHLPSPSVSDNYSSPSGFGLASGTSFASPLTAGVIACMLQGYQRLTSRQQVQAVNAKLILNSTKGKLKRFGTPYPDAAINNRILYIDPDISFELINGLVPL